MAFSPRISTALAASALALAGGVIVPSAAQAAGVFDNCTSLHHRWPHGVGRRHAHDHTTGTPVTNFRHSTRLYRRAMNHNSTLDADKDGIACEQA